MPRQVERLSLTGIRSPHLRTSRPLATLLLACVLAASGNAQPTPEPVVEARVLWLESVGGTCGPNFAEPAVPIVLAPAAYPAHARRASIEFTVRVDGIITAEGTIVDATARSAVPLLAEAATEALRAFIEGADSFAIFEMIDGRSGQVPRRQGCPTRDLDLRTCGGRYSFPYAIVEPASLTDDEVARLKDLLLVRSACWVAPKGAIDLRFAGSAPGYEYGISVRRGDQEMFILINLSRTCVGNEW